MSGRSLNTGANRQVNVGDQIDGDVAHSGLEHRVISLSMRADELRNNWARPSLNMRGGYSPKLNPPAAGLSFDGTAGGIDFNAASAGLGGYVAGDFTELDCASGGFGLYFASAFIHVNCAGASLKRGALRP